MGARSFDLPDGTVIQLPHDIRMAAPEVLFEGDVSIPGICQQAIETVDLDFQQDLVRSVVIAGGTSMLPGLQERVKYDMQQRLPDLSRSVDVTADSQRKHAAWIGGSML